MAHSWFFFPLADSDESAKREIEFFFPEFNYEDWYITHEPLLRSGIKLQNSVEPAEKYNFESRLVTER